MVENNTQVWRVFLVCCPENVNEGISHNQHSSFQTNAEPHLE